MVHDPVVQIHDKYNLFLSSSSFNLNGANTSSTEILILLLYFAVQLDLRAVTNWNRSHLQCSQHN